MLYKIEGTEKNLKPYLIAAHIDVVPAKLEDGKWSHEPFSAEIENGHIYARGSMDDKANMLGQLEAIRFYLKKFGQPKRTIYLAYGHDEEASGLDGANNMAKLLANVSLEYVLDEGSMVIEDIFPDIKEPISYISVADKGYLTIKFFVNVTGGHSSMPNADESAIFILADAISKLKNKKLPSQLGNGPEVRILEELALNFDFFKRVAMSNVWFFNPILK
jgi:carboxypeptidase PM20D1